MMMPRIVVTIEIPAVSELVLFFKGRQQAQIDQLTTKVEELTATLNQSSAELANSVDEVKE